LCYRFCMAGSEATSQRGDATNLGFEPPISQREIRGNFLFESALTH
jgi:hypothetical protein